MIQNIHFFLLFSPIPFVPQNIVFTRALAILIYFAITLTKTPRAFPSVWISGALSLSQTILIYLQLFTIKASPLCWENLDSCLKQGCHWIVFLKMLLKRRNFLLVNLESNMSGESTFLYPDSNLLYGMWTKILQFFSLIEMPIARVVDSPSDKSEKTECLSR